MSVTVDRNGDIVVIDNNCCGSNKINKTSYRLVNFTFKGEVNFQVCLDHLRPVVDATVDRHNNYYVAGTTLVRKYRREELLLQFTPHYNANSMKLPSISCVRFNLDREEIFLLDQVNSSIQAFDGESGRFLYIIDLSESIESPSKFHIKDKQTLVVSNLSADSILVCQLHKNSIIHTKRFGSTGIGQGEFVSPSSITSDHSGNILVCDSGNHRVCVLNCHGEYRTCIGQLGGGLRSFKSPMDLHLHTQQSDGSVILLVADKLNNRVLVYF